MSLIECKNINRCFGSGENRVHILKDISLSIEKGDFVAIIGQSGSGKSTLMNILGCLDTAGSGSYRIDGIETAKMQPDELAALRRERFGFIFQRYNLLSSLTARDNVALPAVYMGMGGKERSARADKLLQDLGLASKEGNKPGELSGGQQQRVSIARALMNGGEIIFADEPTGALDTASGKNVMEIIRRLHEAGHTVIMVTHDPGIAANANRVIEIRDGEIISDTSKNPEIPASNVGRIQEKASWSFYYDQFVEAFRMSVQAVLAHKMRSLLTMLGIIIGIASVVSVVALGNGSQKKILEDISSMGTNTISIFPGRGFGDRRSGKIKTLTIDDAKIIAKQSYVASATPMTSSGGTLTYRNTDLTASLYGVGEQYFDVRGLKLETGRLFDENDVKEDAQVVVIDQNVKDKLFADSDPLGKTILFRKRPLTVIGVMKKDGQFRRADALVALYDGDAPNHRREPHQLHHRQNQRQCQYPGCRKRAGRAAQSTARHGRLLYEQQRQHQADGRKHHRYDEAADFLHRPDFIGSRRHRRDEHHAGVRYRAHQRNRHTDGNRRAARQYFAAVFD